MSLSVSFHRRHGAFCSDLLRALRCGLNSSEKVSLDLPKLNSIVVVMLVVFLVVMVMEVVVCTARGRCNPSYDAVIVCCTRKWLSYRKTYVVRRLLLTLRCWCSSSLLPHGRLAGCNTLSLRHRRITRVKVRVCGRDVTGDKWKLSFISPSDVHHRVPLVVVVKGSQITATVWFPLRQKLYVSSAVHTCDLWWMCVDVSDSTEHCGAPDVNEVLINRMIVLCRQQKNKRKPYVTFSFLRFFFYKIVLSCFRLKLIANPVL